jgi:hypothetical protein
MIEGGFPIGGSFTPADPPRGGDAQAESSLAWGLVTFTDNRFVFGQEYWRAI